MLRSIIHQHSVLIFYLSLALRLATPSSDSVQFDERDLANLNALSIMGVQEWCKTRTSEYRTYVGALKSLQQYDKARALELPKDLSKDDARALLMLSIDSEDVLPWCTKRIYEYKARIRALRVIHNAAAPINHLLPPELLMQVFQNVEYPVRRRDVYAQALARVCRTWYSVICGTPQFWVNLLSFRRDMISPSPRSLRSFELALQRSGALPLAISLRGFPSSVADLLQSHRQRVSSLTVAFVNNNHSALLEGFLCQEMHSVKELQVYPEGKTSVLHPSHPLAACYPRLVTLRTAIMHFHPECVPSSLRHLELNFCRCAYINLERHPHHATLPQLINALQRCPSLETLRITWCLPWERQSNSSPEETVPVVQLPFLRSLYLHDPSVSIASFLSRLRLPPTTAIHMKTDAALSFAPPLHLSLPAHFSCVDTAIVRLSGSEIRFETYRADGTVAHISASCTGRSTWDFADAPVEYTNTVANVFASAQAITRLVVTEVRLLYYNSPVWTARVWRALLRGFPSIERLEVPPGTAVDVVAQVLADSEDAPDRRDPTNDISAEGAPRCMVDFGAGVIVKTPTGRPDVVVAVFER